MEWWICKGKWKHFDYVSLMVELLGIKILQMGMRDPNWILENV
jgi:hypothetical protein